MLVHISVKPIMVSLKYFSILLLLVCVNAIFGAEGTSNGSNTESKSSNITKISWYSDKNKGNTENVKPNADSQNKAGEKVQGAINDDGKMNHNKTDTKETGDSGKIMGKHKQDKDLTLEELLKTIEGDKVAQSNPSSTTPDPSRYDNGYGNSGNDFGNYPSSFSYSPFTPEDPYSAAYDDYPPIPPPYPYTRYPNPSSSSSPASHYQGSSASYGTSETGNYAPNYFPDEYQPPASWYDPNYYPDETFDDSNNANNFYSGESYTSEETEVDKRHAKSIHPLDMVYRLNDPVFLDKPCACSGFADNAQYKRHAFPPSPFGPTDDHPLKFDLPKPQWIEKLKQLREEKKQKKTEFEPSHVKSRSADDDDSPLPSNFFEEGSGSGFGNIFTSQHLNKEDGDSFFS